MSVPAPDQLGVSLFGTPGIVYANKPLAIPRRQVRALLYRLATDPHPLSRSHLGTLFWDDLPERAALRNLSRLLALLAKNLPDAGFLIVDEDHVQLNPAQTWVDTHAFSRLWDAWERTHSQEDLHAAARLYRGPFLDGFTLSGSAGFDEWAGQEAECWEQRFLIVLEALIDETSSQGDFPHAIEFAHQYLRLNDLAEAVHCRLIELYAALGDRSAALRQYELCCQVLQRDLGVKPAPETHAAYRAVVEQKEPRAEAAGGLATWDASPDLQLPFIGRDAILQHLNHRLSRARYGNGGIVLISGEAGAGKTHLLREFTRRQRVRTRLVAASASPESGSMPYQPIVEALRPVLKTAEILSQVHSPWLVEASRLMPELCLMTRQDQPQAVLGAGESRARIFEALCQIIFSLGRGGYTVLLCLDDLQWADATTLDWLAYLARRLHGQRVLLIGSYRVEDSEPLAGLRQVLTRHADFSEVYVPGFDREETLRLVSLLSGAVSISPGQAERLYQQTDGNPFFILETLRASRELSAPLKLEGHSDLVSLPDSILQAVNFRLEKLHPGARQVLEVGAVLGQAFDFETLLATAGRGEMETLDELDELTARQFLEESGAGYRFCHIIVREAVYAGLSHWRRRVLHRRAGQALEKFHAGDAPALARHFEGAGEAGRAAAYLHQAGQAARAVFAHVEARSCFDRALDLLKLEAESIHDPEVAASNLRRRIQVLFDRGWALRLLGEMDTYAQDLEEVRHLTLGMADAHLQAHLSWQLAYNHRWFCRYGSARSCAENGVRISREIGDAFLEAVCQRELGMADRETGDFEKARTALELALGMFIRLKDTLFTIHTLSNLSTLYCHMQEPELAAQAARQALELCEQKDLRYERRLPLGDLGAALAQVENFGEARTLLEESLAIAREITDRTQEIFCLGHLGRVLGRVGEAEAAASAFNAALSLAEETGSRSEQSWLHAGLAEIQLACGNSQQAGAHACRALEIADALGGEADARRAKQVLARLQCPDSS